MNRRDHLMIIAMEECNEVAHRISKAARFGMEQVQTAIGDKPEQNPNRLTNRERIYEEYFQLRATPGMIGIDAWCITPNASRIEQEKVDKVNKYMLLSAEQGTLQEDK